MDGSRAWRRWRHWAAAVAAGALAAALLPGIRADAAGTRGAPGKPVYNPPVYRGKLWVPRKLPSMPSVGGHSLPANAGKRARPSLKPLPEPGSVPAVPYRLPSRVWWPSGSGTAVLSETVPVRVGRITGETTRALAGPQRAGNLPVTVTGLAGGAAADHQADDAYAGPTAVQVSLAPRRVARAEGVSGLVFRVSGGPSGGSGRVLVRLNYSKFAKDYGGSWASRLRLVEFPPCALTTPGAPGCRTPIWVPGSNDGTHSVWATVRLGPATTNVGPPATGRTEPQFSSHVGVGATGFVVLAALSTPGGEAGNYAATSLSPEGNWSVQQGNFNYDYPIAVPPSLGGAAPDVTLSYSSEMIDGETSAQNPQGSQIGDGWTYSPGFIEQSYEPCSEDSAATAAEAGDDCWDGYNATLSLGGHSGVLIGSGTGTWHLQNDDGTKVQLETGGSNGMWKNEYWVVTTTDGTKYYFGADHVPGDSSSSLTTDSAWNVPVYCPATTDPCYTSSAGTSSWTQMPYRWNLDYVVDPDNNLTVYQYATETNYYMRGGSTGSGTLTSYIRSGYLTTILYGWQLPDATASPAVYAADKITFGPSDRCLSSCSTVTKAAYPDVPTDQICASGDTSCDNASPTFFSEKRLTSIDTYVLESQSSDSYSEADSYSLQQQFQTGTGETTAVMSLASITRNGESLPSTNFAVTMMNNRVLGTTQPAEYRPRITAIQTEADAVISVDYNPPECTQGTGGNITDADAPTNTMTCYPAFWAPPNEPNSMDWFDYYTVSSVQESDQSGAKSVPHVTDYSYSNDTGVAWHYDESPAESSKYRTWDEYRGYLKIETTTGETPDPITETMTWYMRGMDGDNNGSGGTKSVSVTDSLQDSYTDSNYLSGQVLETDTYNEAGGSPDTETINGPWTYNATASMTPPSGSGLSTMSSYMLAQSRLRTRRLLASGNWQTSTTTDYYNGSGLIAAADTAPAGLTETCTSTGYATPPSGNAEMLAYPDEVTVVTGAYDTSTSACPAASSKNIVSDNETYYDDETATVGSLGTLGSLTSPGGLQTGQREASGWPTTGETWQPETATQHDQYGRVTSAANADGDVTTTGYSPATEALPTSVTVKNPLKWKTVTTLDQDRQLPLTITDPNGEVTTETYDSLGRLTSVTLPIDQGGDETYKYSYSITGSSPPSITTQTLRDDGSYSTDIKIFDGMLQLIEEQSSTADNSAGRLVTYTSYDSHGWQATTTPKAFFNNSTSGPVSQLFTPNADQIPAQTVNTYDGQGRITAAAFYSLGVDQWQTSTSYPGMDQTDVTPPAGGTATSVITNSVGQTSQSMAYYDSSGDADTTSYTYTPAGQVTAIADNNGNAWSFDYNLLGQKISATDPGTTGSAGPSGNAGTTSYTYDGNGNLLSSKDPNGTVLTYKYDGLGRKTAEYNATPGVPGEPVELASWAYDKTPLNGGADAVGQPTSNTSYDSSGQAYTESITGYNTAYEATGTALSIPTDQGALQTGTTSNEYTTTTAYTPRTGLAEYTTYSNDGGLPQETVFNTYDEAGLLTQFGDSTDYLDSVSYDPLGQVLSTTFGPSGTQLVQDYTYDAGTSRLLQSITNLQPLSSAADTTNYTYDPSGNITSTSDVQNTGGTQTQCFTYDDLDQLTAAWTDTGGTQTAPGPSVEGIGGCNNTSPSAANIGGPAPYWETYTYDLLGDRTSETTYDTALPASQDTLANATTQEVEYPGGNLNSSPGSNAPTTAQSQPDSAASVVTASPGGTTTTTPDYNADGQLTSQDVTKTTGTTPPSGPPGLSQVTYTPQGEVASATANGKTTSYTYDANGNLLIEADPGSTTLYADGGAEEITLTGSTLSGLRFFTASPDGATIVENSSGVDYYELGNQQGTALESIQTSSLAITRRYFDPWGDPVAPTPLSWPDSNAFLGKPEDPNTALDVLGSRDYDPATGSFISLDPLLEAGSPQQMGGYAYAADNPVTHEDPTGQVACIDNGYTCASYQYYLAHPDAGDSSGTSSSGSSSGGWETYLGFVGTYLPTISPAIHFDFHREFITEFGSVTIDANLQVTPATPDSMVKLTMGQDLSGDCSIQPPVGPPVDIPVRLLAETKAAASLGTETGGEGRFCGGCTFTPETSAVSLGGIPFTLSLSIGLMSVTIDLNYSGAYRQGKTEVANVSMDDSITFQRSSNPSGEDPPPELASQLAQAESHPLPTFLKPAVEVGAGIVGVGYAIWKAFTTACGGPCPVPG